MATFCIIYYFCVCHIYIIHNTYIWNWQEIQLHIMEYLCIILCICINVTHTHIRKRLKSVGYIRDMFDVKVLCDPSWGCVSFCRVYIYGPHIWFLSRSNSKSVQYVQLTFLFASWWWCIDICTWHMENKRDCHSWRLIILKDYRILPLSYMKHVGEG